MVAFHNACHIPHGKLERRFVVVICCAGRAWSLDTISAVNVRLGILAKPDMKKLARCAVTEISWNIGGFVQFSQSTQRNQYFPLKTREELKNL